MNVPPKNHPRWSEIVTGKKTYELKFLAAKIMLGRVVRNVSAAPTPDNIKDAVEHLHSMYEKNAASPSVQEDLQNIFK